MLTKKLYKTTLVAMLVSSTIAYANPKFNIGLTANVSTYSTNVDHLHNDMHNYWYHTPNIIICESANISKNRVQDAVNFWKDKGFKLGKVMLEKESSKKCPTKVGQEHSMENYIFITKDMTGMSGKSWGATQRYYDWCNSMYSNHENHCLSGQGRHSYVVSAHIEISDDVQERHLNPTSLVAHELGHALGFSHVSDYTDIMSGRSTGYAAY